MYDSATRGIMTAKHDLLQFIDYLFLQLSIDYLISIIHLKLILDYEKFSYINHHYKILTGHIPWSNDVHALHKQKFVKKRWRWTVRVMRWLEGNARRAMLTAIKSLSDTFLCHILFLKTKEVASVLSRRWRPLALSSPALHFRLFTPTKMLKTIRPISDILVNTVILLQDAVQPIQRFNLECVFFLWHFHARCSATQSWAP